MTEEKSRSGYVMNKKVFHVRVEVAADEMRAALLLVADPLGDDIADRNSAIQKWLEEVVGEGVQAAKLCYEQVAIKRAQEEERKALEAERQELRDLLDGAKEAEERLKELDEELSGPPGEIDLMVELKSSLASLGKLEDALDDVDVASDRPSIRSYGNDPLPQPLPPTRTFKEVLADAAPDLLEESEKAAKAAAGGES